MLNPDRLEELHKFGTGELMPGADRREEVYREAIRELVERLRMARVEWDRTINRMQSSLGAVENLKHVVEGHLQRSKGDRSRANDG